MSEFTENKDERIASFVTGADHLFDYMFNMIYKPESASLDLTLLPEEFLDLAKGLEYIFVILTETKKLAKELSKGNLNCDLPPSTNEIASPLKSLHAALRHLTWQTQQVARGDYSQKVEFMGDFSNSFNRMINQLKQRRKIDSSERARLENYVKLILESCSNPLLFFNDIGELVYISNSWFNYCKRFTDEDIFGKRIDELFTDVVSLDSLKKINTLYDNARNENKILESDFDIDFGYHEPYSHFGMQFTPMINDDGSVGGLMLFMFDLTESERARNEAEKARPCKTSDYCRPGTFLGGILCVFL